MFIPRVIGSAAYQIKNSLRTRASAPGYISKTLPGTATVEAQKWTLSMWVKRGALGIGRLFDADQSGTALNAVYFGSNDELAFYFEASTNKSLWVTPAAFRDPAAWYHIVAVFDSTQATQFDRFKLWVNGVSQALTINNLSTSGLALNQTGYIGGNYPHYFGYSPVYPTYSVEGYYAEINFVAGQALNHSYFGSTDVVTGSWVPKKYTGTYGTNGFYLPFSDGSSLSALCADKSGNGNNWTPSGISLTAGVTYDWMVDTPTNNYAMLNRVGLDGGNANLFSNGSLSVSANGTGTDSRVKSTFPIPLTGKYHLEWTNTGFTSGDSLVGVKLNEFVQVAAASSSAIYVQLSSNVTSGVYVAGALVQALPLANGDVVGLSLDADTGTAYVYQNGVLKYTSSAGLSLAGNFIGGFCSQTSSLNFNFGQRPFAYTLPAGFKALCTANLPSVPVVSPKKHFDVKLFAGNGGTQAVSGVGFKPDLVWLKNRSISAFNLLYDSVRGVQKQLSSNDTGAEWTNANGVASFDTSGFTVGSDAAGNNSGNAIVSWLWKAGGAAVANNAGSISSQVSVNTLAGFSIVTYTGTGAAGTVGHGLGAAPAVVIAKARSVGGAAYGWPVFHKSMNAVPQNYVMGLQDTGGAFANSTYWNNTTPSSSAFTIGTHASINEAAKTYVAYCFAEVPGFSKFGNYTGNGSADGPFVYCGFRPRFVLIKNASTSVDNWVIEDSARDAYNPEQSILIPNTSGAESINSAFAVDFTANGFKVRGTSTAFNGNGNTHIFMAFAEYPFGGAGIAPATAR